MLETGRETNIFPSYQIGFCARLSKNKAFIEVLFSFVTNRVPPDPAQPGLRFLKLETPWSFYLAFVIERS